MGPDSSPIPRNAFVQKRGVGILLGVRKSSPFFTSLNLKVASDPMNGHKEDGGVGRCVLQGMVNKSSDILKPFS